MSISFRIVESPEPVRASMQASSRVIADVGKIIGSSITLYASTRVLKGEYASVIVEENKHEFINPKRWRVNMAYPLDRAGIQQFKSVPLDILIKFWKKPIDIKESGLTPLGSGIFKFNNPNYFGNRSVTCYLLWPEIGTDPMGPVVGGTNLPEQARKILRWMYEHSPEIIPFTDADSVFIDPSTEVTYISDLMG
ncbi:MAG: hypothetical protein ACC656_13770 [Candidatus Heimdallarchaeota archaeon]